MSAVVERYVRAMERRGLAVSTVDKRRHELRRWLDWTGGRWPVAQRADVEAWLDGRELAPTSRRDAIGHLHAFYLWAAREGFGVDDPTILVERPRTARRLPRPAKAGEVDRAVEVAPPWLRTALLLMVDAGLRCCEVVRLTWADVDVEAGTLHVTGKGGHERVVGLPARLSAELVDGLLGATGPVIGRNITPCRMSQIAAEHLRSTGGNCTAHQLRHLYATRLLDATAGNVLAVQQALGHASVTSTQIYARVSPAVALDAARALDAHAE